MNEKNGVMLNQQGRFQRLRALLAAPLGTIPEWQILDRLASASGVEILPDGISDDRSLFRHIVSQCDEFSSLSLMRIGALGVTLQELRGKSK